jgi:hypothetical protein
MEKLELRVALLSGNILWRLDGLLAKLAGIFSW